MSPDQNQRPAAALGRLCSAKDTPQLRQPWHRATPAHSSPKPPLRSLVDQLRPGISTLHSRTIQHASHPGSPPIDPRGTAQDDRSPAFVHAGPVPRAASGASHATTKNAAQGSHGEVGKKEVHQGETGASSSEESRSDRDRRLYRECKGRANAGACLGYTSKP